MLKTNLQFTPLTGDALAELSKSDSFVDDPQLAAILGVSKRTLEGWRRRHKLPYLQLSHRCVRYRLSEVLRCLAEQYTVKETTLHALGATKAARPPTKKAHPEPKPAR